MMIVGLPRSVRAVHSGQNSNCGGAGKSDVFGTNA
jgi:hypothetical protein